MREVSNGAVICFMLFAELVMLQWFYFEAFYFELILSSQVKHGGKNDFASSCRFWKCLSSFAETGSHFWIGYVMASSVF